MHATLDLQPRAIFIIYIGTLTVHAPCMVWACSCVGYVWIISVVFCMWMLVYLSHGHVQTVSIYYHQTPQHQPGM